MNKFINSVAMFGSVTAMSACGGGGSSTEVKAAPPAELAAVIASPGPPAGPSPAPKQSAAPPPSPVSAPAPAPAPLPLPLPNVVTPADSGSPASNEKRPVSLWVSQPVDANETVVVAAANSAPTAVVQTQRLADDLPGSPLTVPTALRSGWSDVSPLQATAQSVKFVPPPQGAGVYAFRISAEGVIGPVALVNAPEIWFVQGDLGWAASPGGRLDIYGTALGNISAGALPPRIALVKDGVVAATVIADAPAAAVEAKFSAGFTLPPLPVGRYTLYFHNGSGGPAAWGRFSGFGVGPNRSLPAQTIETVTIAARTTWPSTICSVPAPRGNGVSDDDNLQAAFTCAQASGGGTIRLQGGRYTLSAQYAQGFGSTIPHRTVVGGQGKAATELHFPLATSGDLFAGRGSYVEQGGFNRNYVAGVYGVENLAITAPLLRSGVGIRFAHMPLADAGSGPFVKQVNMDLGQGGPSDTTGIHAGNVSNIQLRSNDVSAGEPVQFNGQVFGVTVTDNTLRWYHDALRFNFFAQNGVFTGNTLLQMAHEAPTGAVERAFAAPSRDVYYARNISKTNRPASASVWGVTMDEGHGLYMGRVASSDGTVLKLQGDLSGLRSPNGYSAMVMSGTGAGQMRFIVRADGPRIVVVERPWTVELDNTSVVGVISTLGRMLFVNNEYGVQGAQNSFFTSADVIQAYNRMTVPGTLIQQTGVYTGDGLIPGWHYQMLGNTVGQSGALVGQGGGPRGLAGYTWYTDKITQTNIIRGNRFAAGATGDVALWDSVGNSLIENNVTSVVRLQNAGSMRDVLLRGNRSTTGAASHLELNQPVPADVKVVP